jgi:hypothetical protein
MSEEALRDQDRRAFWYIVAICLLPWCLTRCAALEPDRCRTDPPHPLTTKRGHVPRFLCPLADTSSHYPADPKSRNMTYIKSSHFNLT